MSITSAASAHPVTDGLARTAMNDGLARTAMNDGRRQDMSLVARAVDGDEQAWAQLAADYGGLLRWIGASCRLSREETEDAAQTTWLRLFENAHKLRELDKLPGWLSVTMRRECILLKTRSMRERPAAGEWTFDRMVDDRGIDHEMLTNERNDMLWAAVDRLPLRQRQLMQALTSYPAPSYKQISSTLSMPVGSIGPVRARALQNLRQILREMATVEVALDLAA